MTNKLNILQNILGSFRYSGQECLFLCPFCKHHKNKFSVNVEKNVYKCWVCDTRGKDLYKLVRKFGTYDQIQKWKELSGKVDINDFEELFKTREVQPEEKVVLPEEFITLSSKNLPPTALQAMNYLAKRGLKKSDIVRWKIGFCYDGEYGGRVIIPSFGKDGSPNFFVGRTYRDDWMRYKNPQTSRDIIFNELFIDWDQDIILVEGVFDAIRAGNFGSAIPLLGSTLRVESKLFQEIHKHKPRVYLALDNDAQEKTRNIAKKLRSYDIDTRIINTKDYEDIAEMDKDVILSRKENAKIASPEQMLRDKIMSI